MEQCQKIERVTRFGVVISNKPQTDKSRGRHPRRSGRLGNNKNSFWKRYHMKKNIILWLAASAVVMLAFPWLAVTFVKGDAGMAVCFLLFFAVNPLYSVIIGAFAGKDVKHLWSLPVISAVLFLIGTWIFFDMGETAFILYAAVYLVIGIMAMLISMFIRKKTQE